MTQTTSSGTRKPLAIYVHWPFCKSKCPYCDFNSHVREGVDADAWHLALLQELDHMATQLPPDYSICSIFFGGGTPSLMPPKTVAAIIDRVTELWPVDPDIEITLEANPTSVEAARFAAFRQAGVNRVSMGIQSLRPQALVFLGREHSASEALAALDVAKHTFTRVSFDLIYARPEQSLIDWETELKEALAHADGHLSLYQLTIEQGTAFHHAYHHKGAFSLPPDDTAAEMFSLTLDLLRDAGLPAYEVSNHARTGQESRHNLCYWRGEPYIGIGPGAHGRLYDGAGWIATQTLKSPERWLESAQSKNHGIEVYDSLTLPERQLEYILMGLRIREGIDVDGWQLQPLLNDKAIDRAVSHQLLARNGSRLIPTDAGWLVLNHLIADIVA